MSIKELQDKLRLAKNKDAQVVFLVGDKIVALDTMAEVVADKNGIHFPSLGETNNAVAIKLTVPVVEESKKENV